MIFKDDRHKNAFYQILGKMQLNHSDPERTALAYLLSLNEDCHSHINNLYDFEERVILPEGLDQEWQTHTSLKTTHLAFNLYNGYCLTDRLTQTLRATRMTFQANIIAPSICSLAAMLHITGRQ